MKNKKIKHIRGPLDAPKKTWDRLKAMSEKTGKPMQEILRIIVDVGLDNFDDFQKDYNLKLMVMSKKQRVDKIKKSKE